MLVVATISPACVQDRLGVSLPGHHPAGAAVAGAAATVFHDAVMTPMDLVKQRLQLGYHKGIVDCVLTVQRSEGIQVKGWNNEAFGSRSMYLYLIQSVKHRRGHFLPT